MSKSNENKTEEVPIDYEYDSDYRIVAANGMYGGITPRGDLRVDFFVEHQPAPEPGEFAYETRPDGTAKEVRKSKKKKLVRRVQIGVLLPAQHIEGFAQWFQKKADQIREMADKQTETKVH